MCNSNGVRDLYCHQFLTGFSCSAYFQLTGLSIGLVGPCNFQKRRLQAPVFLKILNCQAGENKNLLITRGRLAKSERREAQLLSIQLINELYPIIIECQETRADLISSRPSCFTRT